MFSRVLPPHIDVDKFKGIIITAVNTNPGLVAADRRSFFNSAVKAAADGLLPDGREGALVVYNTNVKTQVDSGGGRMVDKWDKVKMIQWMPMVFGVRKKIRNSGEVLDLWADVVYEKDQFEAYRSGDGHVFMHKPNHFGDRGAVIGAYSYAKLKNGEVSFDTMSVSEMMKVWQQSSKNAKDGKPSGPWKDWREEMFKKTVLRRHAKQLPMSTDILELINREDAEDIEVKAFADEAPKRPQLADFSKDQIDVTPAYDGDEEPEPEPVAQKKPAAETTTQIADNQASVNARSAALSDAFAQGEVAYRAGKRLLEMPDAIERDKDLKQEFMNGWKAADAETKEGANAKA